jgi:hypothetical protein
MGCAVIAYGENIGIANHDHPHPAFMFGLDRANPEVRPDFVLESIWFENSPERRR